MKLVIVVVVVLLCILAVAGLSVADDSPAAHVRPERISRAVECVRRNLRLDSRGLPTARAAEMRGALPLLVTPLSSDVEARYFVSFVCNLDVPVRYHYVVHNGRDGVALAALVSALRAALGDSQRLIVRRNPTPLGSAESLNQGLRWGIEQRGNAEVPYAVAANVDVWFGPGTLPKMIQMADAQAAADAPVLAALQAEVEQEQRWAAEGNLTYYHTHVPPGRPLVVLREGAPGVPSTVRTSRLLPDRLRYMYKAVNYPECTIPASAPPRPFQGRFGILYPVPGETSFTVYTRLLLSTAGFLDENFFPVYMEDIDIRWRAAALGFAATHAVPAASERFMHIRAVTVNQPLAASPRRDGELRAFHANRKRAAQVAYQRIKYGWADNFDGGTPCSSGPPPYAHTFFNTPHFPADVWLADAAVRECFDERRYSAEGRLWRQPLRCVFDTGAIVRAGVLGDEQLQATLELTKRLRDNYDLPPFPNCRKHWQCM